MEYYQTENGFAYGKPPVARIVTRRIGVDKLAIDHTYVSAELRGQGIARQLVLLAVEQAQKEGRLIVPLCSYAARVLNENPALSELITFL
ncbi:GNAT family N-acetyltransferase [Sphaerochaeta globosa]|jgi:hypothetical protein|uniref:N-acetyltransferase domain-containing protein n=1 Tax=Sphaerochaeta globosa (strain ATCC BAA-1886 / DSM 22777 / Buddy) TaxID=158189 RepID=F0RYU3_SPHGB|nr:GNAT family N-acetyltransferase [Sphaerochaeta globosa]ADY13079.1 hypothetical protein SpiBuddy_1254 [Sphaerochaeta globosa str. Buddy]